MSWYTCSVYLYVHGVMCNAGRTWPTADVKGAVSNNERSGGGIPCYDTDSRLPSRHDVARVRAVYVTAVFKRLLCTARRNLPVDDDGRFPNRVSLHHTDFPKQFAELALSGVNVLFICSVCTGIAPSVNSAWWLVGRFSVTLPFPTKKKKKKYDNKNYLN